MSENDSATGFSRLLDIVGVKIPAAVTTIAGFIGTVIGLVKLIQGDAGLAFHILLYCGAAVLWFSSFYVYFIKKKPEKPKGFSPLPPPPPPEKLYVFSGNARRIAYHGIYLVPVMMLIGVGVELYFRYKAPDKVIIAVAEFQIIGQSPAGTFEMIMLRLRAATQNYESQIKVVPLGTTITEQGGGNEAAREAGESKKSSIVIWGWSSADSITAFCVPLLRNRRHIPQSGNGPYLNVEVGPEKAWMVEVKRVSEGMAYLVLLTVGLAHYEAQDFVGAVQLLNDAVTQANALTSDDKKKLDLARGYFYLGRALADQGNYDQAIVNYKEALELNPNLVDANLYLGYSQHYVGDDKGVKESFDKAIAQYTQIIRADAADVSAYLNRSSAYSNRGETEDLKSALEDCDAALRLQPQSASAHNNRGIILYKRGDTDAAITEFNEAIRLDPGNSSAYNNRGTAYSKKGEYEKALTDYQLVIEYSPTDSSSYLNRAFVHFDQRQYESAIADYDHAIQFGAANFRTYRNRGWAKMFLGHYDDAARDAAKSLELQNQCNANFVYVTLLGYFGFRKSNNPDAAEALLNSVTADCEHLGWEYSLIKFLRRQIDAQQLLKEAGQNTDHLTEAHTYIGMSLAVSGQPGEAVEHFKWVKENGNSESDEYRLALAEVDRLGPTRSG